MLSVSSKRIVIQMQTNGDIGSHENRTYFHEQPATCFLRPKFLFFWWAYTTQIHFTACPPFLNNAARKQRSFRHFKKGLTYASFLLETSFILLFSLPSPSLSPTIPLEPPRRKKCPALIRCEHIYLCRHDAYFLCYY